MDLNVGHRAKSAAPARLDMLVAHTVSVIIPAYNAARYVEAAIDTALLQEGVDVEVLLIDDCSTDGTAAIAQRKAMLDSRIRVLHMPRNSGPAAARNRGLAAATSEWIALLDADDRFRPGRLRRMLDFAIQHDADITSDNLLLCPETGDGSGTPMLPPEKLHYPHGLSTAEFIRGNIG
ncbi:MAG: glycosyltransferase family 2 protein, partial [Janthinobacterium lividum]